MAFNASNLTVSYFSGPFGPHVMDYTTTDSLATVQGSNYFSDNRFFRFYNLLRVTADDGNAIYDIVATEPVGLRKLANVSSFTSF